MKRFLARARDLFRRRQLVAAFDEEMAFHLDELTREYQQRGYSEVEARAAAQREFGNHVRAREELRAQAGWRGLDELARDIGQAVRGLGRRPILFIGAAVILGLGFAAAITLLVLAEAVLFRPLPVPAPEQLHLVRSADSAHRFVSAGTARRLAAALPSGSSLAAHAIPTGVAVQRGSGAAERVTAQLVGGDFFGALQLGPVAGRLLVPADDRPGAPTSVAVISEPWAIQQFGSAAAAVGQELLVNRHSVAVVGVVPRAFAGVIVGSRPHLWLPASLAPQIGAAGNVLSLSSSDRPNHPDWNQEERVSWLTLVVRAAPGVAAQLPALVTAAAQPQVEEMLAALADPAQREALRQRQWTIEPMPNGYGGLRNWFGQTGQLLAGVVVGLLLLTATNVSCLLLVRALTRHRELGVRLALGSGRWRVSRLVLVEALVIGIAGAAVGALASLWLVPLAGSFVASGVDLRWGVLTGRLLAGVVGLTVLLAVLCSWIPVGWISRLDPLAALAGQLGSARRPLRLVRVLVVAQVALAVTLLTLSLGLGRHLQRLLETDPGYAAASVLTMRFDAGAAGYDAVESQALADRLETVLRGVPGVEAVGLASNGILAGSISRSTLYPRGEHARPPNQDVQSDSVRPDYFAATGLTLLRGRTLLATDGPETPRVAVVTAAFARDFFGTEDVLEERFGYGPESGPEDFTIVGVVADLRVNSLTEAPPPMFFVAAAQAGPGAVPGYLAVKVTDLPQVVAPRLLDTLRQAEPAVVWSRWQTLADRMSNDVRGPRAASRLMFLLAIVALGLAIVGIGVSLAHLVALRRREIAIRMALGADHAQIVQLVLHDAMWLGGSGAAIGLVLALALAQIPLVRGMISEPIAWPTAAIVLLAAAGAAVVGAWRPAVQAVRTNPQQLLQGD